MDAAVPDGPFFLGSSMSFVDVQIAPWVIRLNRVLKPYRGWPEPDPESRWAQWVNAIETNEHVEATTSTDELYLDSYERYAGKHILIWSIFVFVPPTDYRRPFRKQTQYFAASECRQLGTRSTLSYTSFLIGTHEFHGL